MIRLLPILLLTGCASWGVEETETSCRVSGGVITGDFVTEAKEAGKSACVLFDYKSDKCTVHIASTACPESEDL